MPESSLYWLRCARRILFPMMIAVTAAGCSSVPHQFYEGPERDATEVARITNKVDYLQGLSLFREYGESRLIAIDTVKGPNGDGFGYHSQMDGSLNVAMLPGEHSLTVIFRGSKPGYAMRSVLPVTFRFMAEKGRVYVLSYTKTEDSWSPLLVDATTNRQVYPPK